MARPSAAPNMETFEAYFQRADLDRDGRISGQEAVAFFQGANLPKHILAQVWMYADQNRSGFLGQAEFYNALRLVTVAQSGRELTQDIVRAALGPAAVKIPAPQINTAPMPSVKPPGPQVNSGVQPNSQMHAVAPTSSQNLGSRAPPSVSGVGMSQQFFPSSDNQSVRPPQPIPGTSLPLQGASQGLPGTGNMAGPRAQSSNVSNVSVDWLSARPSGVSAGVPSQVPNRGTPPSVSNDGFGLTSGPTASLPPRPQSLSGQTSSLPPRPPTPALPSAQPSPRDRKLLAGSANGFTSDSMFGGDVFSAVPSQPKPGSSTPTVIGSGMPTSSTIMPLATGSQPSVKVGPVDPQSMLVPPTGNNQPQQEPKPQAKQTHLGTSAVAAAGLSVGTVGPASSESESQVPWPRITPSAIQKYNKVFVEVDKDRDGKITGEEARNLFLSWRLPREVLKQVWDLSDQDNDSMLSLREFCTALYLMERYREGRSLPSVLPNSVGFDETLLRITGQPTTAYAGGWQPAPGVFSPGLLPQGMPGARPVSPTTGLKPSPQVVVPSQNDGAEPPVQPKSRVPVLEKHLVSQLSKEEQDALNAKFQEATEAEKKMEELEKEILESKEKIEFYRAKMQELVLYKSRCDNRLNEVTERSYTDKREVELLAKKYEEKYRQTGDVASKLTIEEATFRDIQGKKMEIYNAIVRMEQGKTADGVLQVRAEQIQSDLEELVKALNERCKSYGLRAKPTTLVELPFGWQPGIQESAADWDEDWDKFEDEGFVLVKELSVDVENIVAPPRTKPTYEDKSYDEIFEVKSSKEVDDEVEKPEDDKMEKPVDNKMEKPSAPVELVSESSYTKSKDDLVRSPPGSPMTKAAHESPSQEFLAPKFDKNVDADSSPHGKESYSNHDGAESTVSGDKYADAWGATFDTSDDTDSIWGFNPVTSKDPEHERSGQSYYFGSGELGLNPIRTDSPTAADNFFQRKSGQSYSFGSGELGLHPVRTDSPTAADSFFQRSGHSYSFGSGELGLNPIRTDSPSAADSFFHKSGQSYSFASGELGLNPSRTDSPNAADSFFQKKSSIFADSVPSTPLYNSSFSPRYEGSDNDRSFNSFARFDSFSTHDSGFFPHQETLGRFDSMRSTRASEHNRGFTSFDDNDPFGSTGPFKISETPRRGSDGWSAF